MDIKQFNKNILTIKAQGEKMDILLHETAMYALEQVNKHGNNGVCNQLLGALGRSTRKEALYVWFNDFGMTKKEKDNTLSFNGKKKIYHEGEVISIEDALILADEKPFYDYTKEIAPASSYDVLKGIKAILKRAEKMTKEGKSVEHKELLESLKEFVPAD